MAVKLDSIEMFVDSHKLLEFEVTDLDNLAGASVRWKLSKRASSEAVIVKTDGSGISVDGNKFTVTVEPADNKELKPGTYYHEARVTDSEDNTKPVAYGPVVVIDTLTSSGAIT